MNLEVPAEPYSSTVPHLSSDGATSAELMNAIACQPRTLLTPWVTPLEFQPRLSEHLGVALYVKRDDLTGLAFGGNKIRKIEFYFGRAREACSDTVLITGAVQSNYVRAVAACAARFGMACHLQLENRVASVDSTYQSSGNVLLNELLGAHVHHYPRGEDEEGADRSLNEIAERLKAQGKNPYVIPLGANHVPFGAMGYALCAVELQNQIDSFDFLVTASGSGQTHAGLLLGSRAIRSSAEVIGICVRRRADLQRTRVFGHTQNLSDYLSVKNPVRESDVQLYDDVLAPGYGLLNKQVSEAITQCARLDGLLLDPVYTGRSMAGLFSLIRKGLIRPGAKVVFVHTGGLPAIFGYENELRKIASP
jgi:D-cysteine desulfhydrase family pyridoxal phosphate-dependent enzyme